MRTVKVLLLLALVGTCARVMANAATDALMGVIKTEVVDKYNDYIKSLEGEGDPSLIEGKMQLAADELASVLDTLGAYKKFVSPALRGALIEATADIKMTEAQSGLITNAITKGEVIHAKDLTTDAVAWVRACGLVAMANDPRYGVGFDDADKKATDEFLSKGFEPVQSVALRKALFSDFLANPTVSYAEVDDVLKRTQEEINGINKNVKKTIDIKQTSKDEKSQAQLNLLKKHKEHVASHGKKAAKALKQGAKKKAGEAKKPAGKKKEKKKK